MSPTLRQPRSIDFALVLLLGVLLGSSYVAVKVASSSLGPAALAALRLAIAAAAVGGVSVVRRRVFPRRPRSWVRLFWIGLFYTAIPFFLINVAALHIDTTAIAILTSTGPLIALVLSHLATSDDRMTTAKLLGVVVGFLGPVAVLGVDAMQRVGDSGVGALAAVGAAASFSMGGVLSRRVPDVGAEAMATMALTSGALVMIAVAIMTEPVSVIELGAPQWAAVLYLGLLSTGAAYIVRFKLIAEVGYTFASFSGYFLPVVGVILGALILGERVTLGVMCALVLPLAGLWLSRSEPRRPRLPAQMP